MQERTVVVVGPCNIRVIPVALGSMLRPDRGRRVVQLRGLAMLRCGT